MGGKILGSRITITMDEEVECFAFHNALDKLDRDLPLYAAVVFISWTQCQVFMWPKIFFPLFSVVLIFSFSELLQIVLSFSVSALEITAPHGGYCHGCLFFSHFNLENRREGWKHSTVTKPCRLVISSNHINFLPMWFIQISSFIPQSAGLNGSMLAYVTISDSFYNVQHYL